MKLFDGISDTGTYYKENNESDFKFLNRTNRQEMINCKKIIEQWFQIYPPEHQNEFICRFKSDNNSHQAAFFELYLYNLFSNLGFEINLHPELENKTSHPDFYIVNENKYGFYFEAVVTECQNNQSSTSRKINNVIIDEINRRVKSEDFVLSITENNLPKTPPSINKIVEFIEQHLASLNYDQIKDLSSKQLFSEIPEWSLVELGWDVTIAPLPKEKRGRKNVRTIAISSSDIDFKMQTTSIRKSLLKKGNKYGILKYPLIIGINTYDNVDDEEIINSLFGDHELIYCPPKIELSSFENKYKRISNGVFGNQSKPKYTRISALLFLNGLKPWTISKVNPFLILNPWARNPLLPEEIKLPIAELINDSLVFKPGLTSEQIFNLPYEWPS